MVTKPVQSELTKEVHETIPTLDGLEFPVTIEYGGHRRDFTEEEVVKYFSIGIYRQVWWSHYSSIERKESERREKMIRSILTPEQIEEVNRKLSNS